MRLTLAPLESAAPTDYKNPKLDALHALIESASVLRSAIMRAQSDRSPAWVLRDLERGLASNDVAKQHLYNELHLAPYKPIKE
jgi:hypothetical protein